jgi:hypothetical protein
MFPISFIGGKNEPIPETILGFGLSLSFLSNLYLLEQKTA